MVRFLADADEVFDLLSLSRRGLVDLVKGVDERFMLHGPYYGNIPTVRAVFYVDCPAPHGPGGRISTCVVDITKAMFADCRSCRDVVEMLEREIVEAAKKLKAFVEPEAAVEASGVPEVPA